MLMSADERVNETLEAAGRDRRGQESTPAGTLSRLSRGCLYREGHSRLAAGPAGTGRCRGGLDG